jgi:hypothetical protein
MTVLGTGCVLLSIDTGFATGWFLAATGITGFLATGSGLTYRFATGSGLATGGCERAACFGSCLRGGVPVVRPGDGLGFGRFPTLRDLRFDEGAGELRCRNITREPEAHSKAMLTNIHTDMELSLVESAGDGCWAMKGSSSVSVPVSVSVSLCSGRPA